MISKVLSYFGPRILKTGLGVTLSLLICELLNIETASFAATTVVINMLPSFTNALKDAREQILIHVFSITMAIISGFILGTSPWIIGFVIILFIGIVNQLKWGGVRQGIVSIIFILDAPMEQFLQHAATRSVSIFIGLTVALLINRILVPPRYKERFMESLYDLFIESSNFFVESVQHFVESTKLIEYKKTEPNKLKGDLKQVMKLQDLSREEFTSEDNVLVIERLIEICRGFIERGENIEEMTRQRVKRRQSEYSPLQSEDEISPEFSAILKIIGEGKQILKVLKEEVSFKLVKRQGLPSAFLEPKALDLDYWSKFDQAMERWQSTVSGVFYLRAMMEVAVVATELRWASKRMKSIISLSNSKEKDIL